MVILFGFVRYDLVPNKSNYFFTLIYADYVELGEQCKLKTDYKTKQNRLVAISKLLLFRNMNGFSLIYSRKDGLNQKFVCECIF